MKFGLFRILQNNKWNKLYEIISDYVDDYPNEDPQFTNLIYRNSRIVFAHYLMEKLYGKRRR